MKSAITFCSSQNFPARIGIGGPKVQPQSDDQLPRNAEAIFCSRNQLMSEVLQLVVKCKD